MEMLPSRSWCRLEAGDGFPSGEISAELRACPTCSLPGGILHPSNFHPANLFIPPTVLSRQLLSPWKTKTWPRKGILRPRHSRCANASEHLKLALFVAKGRLVTERLVPEYHHTCNPMDWEWDVDWHRLNVPLSDPLAPTVSHTRRHVTMSQLTKRAIHSLEGKSKVKGRRTRRVPCLLLHTKLALVALLLLLKLLEIGYSVCRALLSLQMECLVTMGARVHYSRRTHTIA
jgi:hypothetical protein